MVVAIGAWFIIVDFPDRAAQPGKISKKSLLTTEEASFVAQRIERDRFVKPCTIFLQFGFIQLTICRGDAIPDPLTLQKFLLHLSDWKLWVSCTRTPARFR